MMSQVMAKAIRSAPRVHTLGYNFTPVLQGLLQFDPEERLTAAEALEKLMSGRQKLMSGRQPKKYAPNMA